jgi:dihydropteroate synthase
MVPDQDYSSSFEDKLFPQKYTFQINGRLFTCETPKVMGIVNLTPDSFYSGSRSDNSLAKAIELIERHITEGADIIDLGGYSSRPGAQEISHTEEADRVLPVVDWLVRNHPEILISVDTFRSQIAESSVHAGAHIINDISAGDLDRDMLATIGKLKVPYIAMHMKGNPKTMQSQTDYSNILTDIMHYFAEKLEDFKKFGIKDVIIDPGFGFAKTVSQNFWILRNVELFKAFAVPVLIGLSRKSMIYKTLHIDSSEALNGTTALHMFALTKGANLLRVHDVKEARQTIELYNTLYPKT